MNAPVVNPILQALVAEEAIDPRFRAALTAADVLSDAGSRLVPCFFVTKVEGEETDRWKVEPITIRQHTRLTTVYSKLAREFECDENGEIVSAVIINELAGIDR